MRYLLKEDVLDYMFGCTNLCTGGGQVAPSLESVDKTISQVIDEGYKLKFIDLKEIPDDARTLRLRNRRRNTNRNDGEVLSLPEIKNHTGQPISIGSGCQN